MTGSERRSDRASERIKFVLTPHAHIIELLCTIPGVQELTECARAAVRTKETYLAAHDAQLRGRRGEAKAIGAIRHDLLVANFHIVRDHVPYRDLGPDWRRKRYSVEHRAGRLQRVRRRSERAELVHKPVHRSN
jgi:hypothetical protein